MAIRQRLMAHRFVAASASAALLTVGLFAAAAPAHAGTITPTVKCVLPAGQGEATGPQAMTVELSPAVVLPGGKVHAKVTLDPGPAKSTVSINDMPTTPSIDLAMSGGATGTVTVRGPEVLLDATSGQAVVIPPYEGDFLVPANAKGAIAFTPLRTVTQTKVFGGTYQTTCSVTAGGGSVGGVTAEGNEGKPATLTTPAEARPHTAVALTGTVWTPNADPTPLLCAADGGGCDPGRFTSDTLAIDANGNLTGTATLADAFAVPDGQYLVKVNDGTKEATGPLTVRAYTPTGPRAIALSANRGPVGTTVVVTGTQYLQDRWINIVGRDADGVTLDDTATYVQSTPDGTFRAEFVVSDPAIAAIQVDEGNDPDTLLAADFTVTEAAAVLSAGAGKTKPGGAFTLSGTGWPAGANPTASLCAPDGTDCQSGRLAGSTLRIGADGTLAGTVTTGSSLAEGSWRVRVEAGGAVADTPVTVARTFITLSTDRGPTGTKVTVVGQGFAPVATVSIAGLRANGDKTSDAVKTKVVGLDGAFSQTFTVQAADTVALRVKEVLVNPRVATAAFTVQDGAGAPSGPAFTLSPAEGPLGTTVQVTGTGFAPVATVSVTGRAADGRQTKDHYVTRVIGLDGSFALNFTVKDPATVALMACEVLIGGKKAQRAFHVTG
ncbi:hypothetical protein ACN20G_00260 [Streptomyces sp. BI20]|uniref:hypothetical protein n=1 Tax=Streptomyces sp. BI20 TaxID=3403460 RepID=UPI003C782D0F